jgi:hypothetical protein
MLINDIVSIAKTIACITAIKTSSIIKGTGSPIGNIEYIVLITTSPE